MALTTDLLPNKLVQQYCREHTTEYIPNDIMCLFIIYCKLDEQFDLKCIGETLKINGHCNNICRCIDAKFGSAFGTNIIKPNSGTHHWKFLLTIDDDPESIGGWHRWDLMVGIVKDNADNLMKIKNSFFTETPNHGYAYIANAGFSTTSTSIGNVYGIALNDEGQHIIDMYLDLDDNKADLVYIVNGKTCDILHKNIDFGINNDINYRMAISVSLKHYTLEILQYNNSFQFQNNNQIICNVGYAECVPDVVAKIIYLKYALMDCSMSSYIHRLYIEALMLKYNLEPAYIHAMKCNLYVDKSDDDILFIRVLFHMALKFYCDKNYVRAINIYEMFDDELIISHDWIWKVAISYHKLHRYDNALKFYKLFLNNNKKTKDNNKHIADCLANMALLYDYKNSVQATSKNIDQAITATKKALEYNPTDAVALNNLGYFYLVKKEYCESYKYLTKSIKIDPNTTLANGNMANLLYGMNKVDESIPYFLKSLSIKGDLEHPEVGPRCIHNYANILYLKQKFRKSNEMCEKLMNRNDFKQNADSHQVFILMSYNYDKLFDHTNSLKYALKAESIKPNLTIYNQQVKKLQFKLYGYSAKKRKKRKKKKKKFK